MTDNQHMRDPGLQPERTALSWHRTAFSVLIFSLAATRAGFSRGDMASAGLGAIAAVLALVLVLVSYHRQKTVAADAELTTPSSVLAKRLISMALCLTALSLALPALLNLIQKGGV